MSLLHRAFRANETAVHELNYLFWECTTRCNLHCRHCGSDCAAASADKDMPLEDFLRAFDTIPEKERAKPFTVVLTGGEPLLRPDIAEAGQALRQRGVGWGMVSNGWFYDEAAHRRLMAAGMGALTISLDGLEDTHDWMRGRPGSWQRARRAIALAAAEPKLQFDVVTCVNKRNFAQLETIYAELQKLGVRQWRIFTVIPIGRAADDPELQLTDEQFGGLMRFIEICLPDGRHLSLRSGRRSGSANDGKGRLADDEQPSFAGLTSESPMRVTFSCEGYLGPWDRRVRDNPHFCHAGINIASVLIDGRISACPNIDRDRFSQGNIYSDSLWEVWQRRFQPFRDRRWTRTGPCAQCRAWRDCLGGGLHLWHGDCEGPLVCHYAKLSGTGARK